MKKVLTKVGLLFILGFVISSSCVPVIDLLGLESPQSAHAESTKGSSKVDLKKYDKYVSVRKNKFVFKAPKGTNRARKLKVAGAIKAANNYVAGHHVTINKYTKEVKPQASVLNFKMKHSKKKSTEYREYWWGLRVIMRTKSAINKQIHDLQTGSVIYGIGAIISAGVGAVGAAYLTKLSSDLSYVHSKHPKSKLYMDINRFFVYKIKVWKHA